METSLNKIKAYNPCEDGWEKLLDYLGKDAHDDDPIKVTPEMINVIGIKDAVWGLRAIEGHDKEIRRFACACARLTLPIFEKEYPDDNRPRHAIETAAWAAWAAWATWAGASATTAAWASWAGASATTAAWAGASATTAAWAAWAYTDAWGRVENIFCGIFCGVYNKDDTV